jgi:hypothetical protein
MGSQKASAHSTEDAAGMKMKRMFHGVSMMMKLFAFCTTSQELNAVTSESRKPNVTNMTVVGKKHQVSHIVSSPGRWRNHVTLLV